ncbi:hypothetical protein NDU88_003623 [Pleurodeles waltl]|uniref:Uncharacterized protein n=1 Tax=Pleurodeles waltl TaxID=8319 RepID=A0AAV7NL60_PLEWA|nr:hypothetical protein NDU88_003623 [Pleurodeles waltl]
MSHWIAKYLVAGPVISHARLLQDFTWAPITLIGFTQKHCRSAHQGQLQERSGLQRAVRDAYWRPSAEDEEESPGAQQDGDERGNLLERADNPVGYSVPHSRHPKWPTRHSDGSGFANPGSEDQEAENPTIRPRSGESVALAWYSPTMDSSTLCAGLGGRQEAEGVKYWLGNPREVTESRAADNHTYIQGIK